MFAAMDRSLIQTTMAPNTEDQLKNVTDSSASSPFMNLAPELRLIIYEYALYLDDGAIEVNETTGIPEPALLLTSKEIRHEALPIFYTQNTLHLLIHSYSPATPLLIHRKQEAVLAQYEFYIFVSHIVLDGPANWRNLLAWLRHVHESESPVGIVQVAPPLKTGHRPGALERAKELTVVAGLFDVVGLLDDVRWDVVEKTLGMLRYALAAFDDDWEDEEDED